MRNMLKHAREGYSTATDLADYLVSKNVPFEEAHEIVGKARGQSDLNEQRLHELDLHELNEDDSGFIGPDVYDVLSVEGSIRSRDHEGATAPKQVRRAIDRARKIDIALSNVSEPLLKNF